jgi:hypothetical protein
VNNQKTKITTTTNGLDLLPNFAEPFTTKPRVQNPFNYFGKIFTLRALKPVVLNTLSHDVGQVLGPV